jgi:hypothetical protein
MAAKRRKPAARSGRPGLPIAAIVTTLLAIGLVVAVLALLNHQIRGYFSGGPNRRIAQGAPTPSASVTVVPEVSPAGSAVPGPSPTSSPGPQVAIIIDDCGYSEVRCKLFLQLPIPITLSILPMTPHGKQTQADTLAAGKSVMLHLPMEPESNEACVCGRAGRCWD